MRVKLTAFVMLVASMAPRILTAQDEDQYKSPWRTPWTYEQADHWSQLDPLYALCNTGKAQSPVDIRNARKESLPKLHFEFRNAPLKYVVNNGHTIRVNYHDAPGTANLLVVGNQRYQLTQFHFHHPSEEYVGGKPQEMEIHLMYRAPTGEVAGVTVFIRRGRPNQTIQKVWDHMPKIEGQMALTGIEIDPADLVPQNLAYYRYTGSQTAPPCAEPVTWFVLKTPIEASRSQIEAFAGLYPRDVRPVQPPNGRIVSESQ